MVQSLRSLTLVRKVPGSIPSGAPKRNDSIAARSITASDHGVGTVEDKDFAVSSNQGNALLFVHP